MSAADTRHGSGEVQLCCLLLLRQFDERVLKCVDKFFAPLHLMQFAPEASPKQETALLWKAYPQKLNLELMKVNFVGNTTKNK